MKDIVTTGLNRAQLRIYERAVGYIHAYSQLKGEPPHQVTLAPKQYEMLAGRGDSIIGVKLARMEES